MLYFAAPAFLLLLLVVPLLVWRHRRRRRAGVPHPDLRLFDELPVQSSWLARHGAFLLRALALALLVVALAGPRWPDLRTRLTTDGVAVLMVLDVSGSMTEKDFHGPDGPTSRLEAARQVFTVFVEGGRLDRVRFDGRPADLIGLVRFAARPEVVWPPNLQHDELLRRLESERPADEGGTNIPDAVTVALARLRGLGPHRKVMVLLTDGENNEKNPRSGWSPRQTAQLAATLGITIHTIDTGPQQPSPADEGGRELAMQSLRDLAAITGGEAFAAGDTAALARAVSRIDRLERSPIPSFLYRRYHELYPWFALAAFVLFVLAEGLDRTLWRRVP